MDWQKRKKDQNQFSIIIFQEKNLRRSATTPTMLSPKLSYLPLSLITFLLLAQPHMMIKLNLSSSFPHHMYDYNDHYIYHNNLKIYLQLSNNGTSCFQIWLFQNGTNLAGQPDYKSDTNCGSFTIFRSWNGVRFFQVKAIQLKMPQVDYVLYIYSFSTPNDMRLSAGFESRMLKQFPNMPVAIVNPYISKIYFAATEAYFQYKTSHSNQSMAYFVQSGYGFCLKQNQLSQVYTILTNFTRWHFVTNFSVSNTLRIIPFYYDISVRADEKINGIQPVYWDWRYYYCTSIRPPFPHKKEYFLVLCKIGLIVILMFFDLL